MAAMAKLFLYSFLLSTIRTSIGTDTISPGQSIRDSAGETVISADQSFALGFFSPGSSGTRYLGVWYNRISNGTVIWVANRDNPLLDGSGVLNITGRGVLVLTNSTGHILWSSNVTRTPNNPVARLLETGNLVVKDGSESKDSESYLWQSFEHPCDTFMPAMKLGRSFVTGLDTSITSWKSPNDPARGDYTFGMDPRGFPQLFVWRRGVIKYRLGPWNGIRFVGAPRQRPNPLYTYDFVLDENETYYIYWPISSSPPTRLVMNASGAAERAFWVEKSSSWSLYYATGEDQCDNYAFCGKYASCNINNYPACACLEGFSPKSSTDWSLQDWSGGCVRRNELNCRSGDGFVKYEGIKLPDTSNSWYNRSMSLSQCEEMCLQNCSCKAYANTDIKLGTGCLLWFEDLIDMRDYPDTGQDIYIRMSGAYLDYMERKRKSRERKRIAVIVSSVVLGIVVLALLWLLYKRKRSHSERVKIKNIFDKYYNPRRTEDLDLPMMDMATIARATNRFSTKNLLGQGGFGPVYKGTLPNGQEIAVKRLSGESDQGVEEFINEVILIAKLQHRNLVRLISYCIAGDERMLVYEHMPNKSLDYFIFDQSRSRMLDWHRRISIIDGIARGLLYLHQDSRLRIIHRDLKASNILLDSDMNPKISDFGMARIFGGNQTQANTNKVVGTYGYMAPEYAADGIFSVKSDVFSFGVLVLEIVSGRRNRFFSDDQHHSLLGHAWVLWMEQRILELIDDSLAVGEAFAVSGIIRRIHVGLLCVQQRPEDRPSMSSVVLMLGGDSSLPQPKQPGFFLETDLPEVESLCSNSKPTPSNEITITMLEPR